MSKAGPAVLERLYATVVARKGSDPRVSYTAELLAAGAERCAKKLGEEAIETALAAATGRQAAVIAESADLLYHLLVVWASVGVEPAAVYAALEAREGQSGHAEKAQRRE